MKKFCHADLAFSASFMSSPSLVYSADALTTILRKTDLASGSSMHTTLDSRPWCLAISPDMSQLAVACTEGISVLDGASLDLLAVLDAAVTLSVAFSLDGKWLATGGAGIITLFSAPIVKTPMTATSDGSKGPQAGSTEASNTCIARAPYDTGVYAVLFSPGSTVLVSGAAEGAVVVWSVPQLAITHKLVVRGGGIVCALGFLTDTLFLAGGLDKNIRVWNIETGSLVREITDHHEADINAIAVSSNRSTFASGSSDKTVKIYDAATYTCIKTVPCSGSVRGVEFAGDGTLVIAADKSEIASVNLSTGTIKATYAKLMYPYGLAVANVDPTVPAKTKAPSIVL